jgi:hypothetical protein
MTDPAQSQVPPQRPAWPPQLEARIAALEKAAPPSDFDASSWFWIFLLGIAIPLILLAVGWWA